MEETTLVFIVCVRRGLQSAQVNMHSIGVSPALFTQWVILQESTWLVFCQKDYRVSK